MDSTLITEKFDKSVVLAKYLVMSNFSKHYEVGKKIEVGLYTIKIPKVEYKIISSLMRKKRFTIW